MTAVKMLYALGLPTLCGYLLVSLVPSRQGAAGVAERLALGFGAGMGVLTLETFLLGAAGVPFSAATISMALALTAGGLALLRLRLPPGAPDGAAPPGACNRAAKALLALLLAWVGFKVVFVLFEGFMRPAVLSLDAWWNWGSGAKVFYFSKGLMLDPSSEHFFGRGYRQFLGYPLLNPLAQVWVSLCNGGFDESLAKAFSPVYFVSLLAVFYHALRREAERAHSVVATFLLSSAPLLTYHATDGYSDLPVAFYLLAGSVLLYRHLKSGDAREAALSGLFFSMGAFTKNEGAVFLGAGLAALALHNVIERRRGALGSLASFAVPAALYILPWVAFKAWWSIGYGHGTGTGVGAADEAGGFKWTETIHYEVLPIFFRELFLTVNHAMVFPFLLVITGLGMKVVARSRIKYLYLVLLMILSAFIVVYTATHDYRYIINRAAANRNALTFVPLAFLVASVVAIRLLKGGKKEGL